MPTLEGAVQFRIRNTFVECWEPQSPSSCSDETVKKFQINSCPARYVGRCLPREGDDSEKDDRKALSRETTHSFTGSSTAGSDICGAEFSPGPGDSPESAWMSPTRASSMQPMGGALSDGFEAQSTTTAPEPITTCSSPAMQSFQGIGGALGSPYGQAPFMMCATEGQLMQGPQCGGLPVRVLRLSTALSGAPIPCPMSPPSAPPFAPPSVLPTTPPPPPHRAAIPRHFPQHRDMEVSPQSAASPASKLESSELPSWGSMGHGVGRCKPCAFMHTVGCENGTACQFCHLCEPGEKRRRRKEKIESRKSGRKLRQALAASRAGHVGKTAAH